MENQRIESHGGETKGNMILQKFARRSYLLREEKGGRKKRDWAGRTNQGFLALSRGARARFLLGDDDDDDDDDDKSVDERRG